jgi:uncharacterized SAM-binding protein YcdF (DUF218 family)
MANCHLFMNIVSLLPLLRGLLKSVLAPLPIFWLLLVAVIVLYLAGKKKMAKWFLGSSLLWFLLISSPFPQKMLLATLENQYPPIQSLTRKSNQVSKPDSMIHILVLSSGYESDARLSYCGQLNTKGLGRLTEGIRLQLLLPGSKLIFSGNAGSQPLSQAEVSALAAQELGIVSTVILTFCEPWNTKTEAEEYLKHFGTAYKLYLVTDAAHMPRAVMHFRNAGLNPIPAPTNFIIKKNNIPGDYTDYFPSTGNIRSMEIVFQEYLGMLWAKMGGN